MKRLLFISLTAALILSACGAAAAPRIEGYSESAPVAAPEMMLEAPMAPEPAADFASNETGSGGFETAAVERLVIQNADLTIVVINPETKMDAIGKMAESMGGFVVTKNVYQTRTPNNVKVPEGNITVRVPSEKLEQALEQIKEDAVEVQNESRSGQDVTREYVDLKSRLKTHEQAAEQLSEILNQKTESEEVIEVFNQLVYHREQIEVIKGQINYYEEAAALSAVSVHVTAEETSPAARNCWLATGRCGARCAPDVDQLLPGLCQFPDLAGHHDHTGRAAALRFVVGSMANIPLCLAQVVPTRCKEEKRAGRK